MVTAPARLGNYLDAFVDLEKSVFAREPVWLHQLREEAMAGFSESGFPTTHDEDWRFTNVSAIAQTAFRRAAKDGAAVLPQQIARFRMADAACELVFVNGHFAPQLSAIDNLPPGLEVMSLREGLQNQTKGIERHLGRYLDTRRDAFAALNTALWEDGAYIGVRRRAAIKQAVHVLYLSAGAHGPIMIHPRNLIVAEEQSQAAVIEDYVSLGEDAAFCNSATELIAGDEALISHCMIERENYASSNISTLRIETGRTANVTSHSVLLGGALVRNNVHPVLIGQGAECLINGLFLGGGRQHLDNYMLVEHASPNGSSRQFYNGILDDYARGVFHGRIIVHKDAQKTDAKQTNRNLLLTDDARIDTKPQLEIHADDVKCTHGATIGQIDESALFYLRTRGFDESSARKLLLYAFASECLDRVKEASVRGFVEGLIHARLEAMATESRSEVETTSGVEMPPNLEVGE